QNFKVLKQNLKPLNITIGADKTFERSGDLDIIFLAIVNTPCINNRLVAFGCANIQVSREFKDDQDRCVILTKLIMPPDKMRIKEKITACFFSIIFL
ncbi:MAG: hypothetical protein WCG04_03225, partial [Alphaproteobacteria bacterium]